MFLPVARYWIPSTVLSFGDRSFGAVGPRICTVCRTAHGHLTSATNILRRCWRHICFDKATALCDILYKRLRNILSYLLTYLLFYGTISCQHVWLQLCVTIMPNFSSPKHSSCWDERREQLSLLFINYWFSDKKNFIFRLRSVQWNLRSSTELTFTVFINWFHNWWYINYFQW